MKPVHKSRHPWYKSYDRETKIKEEKNKVMLKRTYEKFHETDLREDLIDELEGEFAR